MFLYSSGATPFHQAQTLWQKFKSLPNLVVVTTLALVIGISTGFGAIFMEWLVRLVHKVFFEDKLWGLLDGMGAYHLIIIPVIGGLSVGTIIIHLARETKGRSVPEVLKAVVVHDENIPPSALAIKSLTSALSVGTGGSVGLGGPTGQLGAALGSTIGQFVTITKDQIRLLFTCGIGAGIGAAFHAPLMGAIFALEVILGHFNAGHFSVVVISAVIADTIAQLYKGPFILVQQYTLVSFWELLLYAILGIIIAISAMGFTKVLSGMKKLWDRLPVSEYVKPMLGGLLLGMVGLFTFQVDGFPRLFGLGTSSLSEALNGSLALNVIFALFLLKIFTTSLTLGSGGAGGTLTPSFFIGAMLGGTFGHLVNLLFPTITSPSGAYALAGMAAFVGGVFHAHKTAILVAFELIGNYHIIWPIMLTILVSTLIANSMNPQYRAKICNQLRSDKIIYFQSQLLRFFCRCTVV